MNALDTIELLVGSEYINKEAFLALSSLERVKDSNQAITNKIVSIKINEKIVTSDNKLANCK